jgi:hypothetical protein
MAQAQKTMSDMLEDLQTGQIAPGSKEGIEAIRQIASASPSDVATKLYHLPNDALERGMRAAGISEDDIEDLLRTGEDIQNPTDPFAEATELTPDDDLLANPNEFDPAADMRNGPRYR